MIEKKVQTRQTYDQIKKRVVKAHRDATKHIYTKTQ